MSSGFGSGKIGLRVLHLPGELPDGWQEKLAAAALPPMVDQVEEVHGWTGWRHVRDTDFDDDTCIRGGIASGMLIKAQRKVPQTTLAAECALEERAVMAAESRDYLSAQRRNEIKRAVRETLMPDMPVTYQGIEWFCAGDLVYCTATSDAAIDLFILVWMQTLGQSINLLDAAGLAELNGSDSREWPPVAFGQQGELFCDHAGNEFLLWLWYNMDRRGGMINVPDIGEFAFTVNSPLVLSSSGKRVAIKSDTAPIDSETQAALVDGMVPQKYRLTLARGAEVWQCMIDSSLVISGLSLPATENFDSVGKFQERAVFIGIFWAMLTALYGTYCAERADAAGWKSVVRKINGWIDDMSLRHGNGLGSDKSLIHNAGGEQ